MEDDGHLLREVAEPFGDRIIWHQPLGKRDLCWLLAGSGVALYPTPAPIAPGFAETSCITAMEALACGLPWISTDRGALPETLRDAGVLVSLADASHAAEPQIVERLASEALGVMRDQAHANRLRAARLEQVQLLGWAPVAEQITAEAVPVIEAKARKRSSSSALERVRSTDGSPPGSWWRPGPRPNGAHGVLRLAAPAKFRPPWATHGASGRSKHADAVCFV